MTDENAGLTVLSLFDGMSCGMLALEKAGVKGAKYYASEIDPYAEKISASNYPGIIRLGDITKWKEWDIDTPDIILAGSPCQGFSCAGKGLNFLDPRSALFFTFVDILKHYKPKYFLLENVRMKKKHEQVISELLGEIYPERRSDAGLFNPGRLEPVLINSALVSAQNRQRLYWCNFDITQPEDKGIFLRDIVEDGVSDRDKSYCIDANHAKSGNEKQYLEKSRRQLIITGGAIRGRNVENPSSRVAGISTKQRLDIKQGGKANCITTVGKDSLCVQIGSADIKGYDSKKRVYDVNHKGPCLTAICGGHQEPKISTDLVTWRKLTVTECERLQTVPDGYCRAVSNSRAYQALGNGWTVDVILHILKGVL